MNAIELIAREMDPKVKLLVKDRRFPHLCPGDGCAVCRWLERPQ